MTAVNRREFLLGTATAAAGTALGGLIATGADLRPTVARALQSPVAVIKVPAP